MTQLGLLAVLGLTSAVAYLVGARALGLSRAGLRVSAVRTLESIGTALIFVAVNLGVGLAATLTVRLVTGRFVSVYGLDDEVWLLLSLLQGLAFHWWRVGAGPTAGSPRGGPLP
jgi:hypothetical protein